MISLMFDRWRHNEVVKKTPLNYTLKQNVLSTTYILVNYALFGTSFIRSYKFYLRFIWGLLVSQSSLADCELYVLL